MAYKESKIPFSVRYNRLLRWREKYIEEKSFVLILAIIVGGLAGTAGVLLKSLIHVIATFVKSGIVETQGNYMYVVLPIVGVLMCMLYVRYLVPDKISHGVTRVLHALSQHKSRLKRSNVYTPICASSVTIGFGGSVGAEGPIVMTGAAIGSNVGQLFRMSPRVLMMLVGAGAGAGIAGIFKAPIAGMLFTIEVLMIDLNTVSVMPLLLASITGATVSYCLTGYEAEFHFMQSEAFVTTRIPYVVLLGIFCGFVSHYFTRVLNKMENVFSHIKNMWHRYAIGASILALLIFLFPPLYGEGYDSLLLLLHDDSAALLDGSIFYPERQSVLMLLAFVGLLTLTKAFATSATTGAGGIGGTFAPTFFVGGMAGFFFALLLNTVFGLDLSLKNFALMGMAGCMAGVMHAPLMGIFLTAEITGSYSLFLPLLIVAALSYVTIRFSQPYSIYAMRLAQRGELLTHHKDKTVLTLLKISNVIENNFHTISPDKDLMEMVKTISQSSRNLFPVVDAEGKLIGVVQLDDIRNIMFRPDLYRKMHVQTFMSSPPAILTTSDNMEHVMKVFDKTGAWNLPVVDECGHYVGFVSKSKIFNSYRRVLRHYSED